MNYLYIYWQKGYFYNDVIVTLKPLFLGDIASTPQGVSKKFKPIVSVI